MSTKAKASAKSTVSTATDAKAPAKAVLAVSPAIQAAIASTATADAAAQAALSASAKQVVILGGKISADKVLGSAPRSDAQAALKPYFVKAFKGDDKYAVEQLSRVLTIAYPGGLKADEKTRTAAAANLAKAIEKNEPTQVILKMASGKLAYTKKGEIATQVKRTRQGGSNAKSPTDTLKKAIEDAVTIAHTGKVPALAAYNILTDALKACKAITDDEADEIGDAIKELL